MRISDWSSDVCSSDLKKALGFHFVAIDEVIDQFGRVILAAQRNLLHRVRHDLHKRRRWQPVEGVLDGAAVVPFTFRQFGFNLIECPDLREARGSTVFIDIAQNIFRSEEHTSELQSLMRISYAVFCLKTKKLAIQ